MEEQMQEGQGSVHPAVNGSLSALRAAPLSGVQESQGSATPARHTPGPWTFASEYGKDVAELPRITTVARCCEFVIGLPSDYPGGNYRDGDPSGDPEADARLIAAAPDLLAALQDIADDYADRFDLASPSTNPGIKSVVLRARAAIARATGASND